jgi:VWFA-related protein
LLALPPVATVEAQEAAREAQQAARPPIFATDLELVNVTATVRDADGRLVPGLKAEDFVLKESGKERPLALFSAAADPTAQSLPLDLALLLDMSGSMIDDQRASREAAVHFLDSVPQARELLVVFFDHEVQVLRYGPGNRAEV